MKTQKSINSFYQLKNWLFNKPVLFSFSLFLLTAIFCTTYAGIQMLFDIHSIYPVYVLFVASFVICTYYIIKKLPHDQLNQNDFIAIANGTSAISIMASLITMLFAVETVHNPIIAQKIMQTYFFHPGLFILFSLIFALLAFYVIGVIVCGTYAKYKRATTIGVTPWKVILSMPFGFLLLWTPGYLIKGPNTKNSLEIKSNWYNNLNQWVVSNSANTIFTFLFLLFCRGTIAGLSTLILYSGLLFIYALWYAKHKSDFIKNINRGYALFSVIVNISLIVAMIYFAITHPEQPTTLGI